MVPVELTQKLAASARPVRLALAAWLAVVVLILAVFHDATASIVRVWANSATYGHGFLILPIAGFLAWRRRDILERRAVAPSLWGALALFAGGVVWLAGQIATVSVLQHFGLVFMIQASVLTVLGWSVGRVLLFPLLYLLLAVPFGDFAIPPLQTLTAIYTVELLRLSDLPVYIESWRIVIPGGAFLVAEACAGARYLLACIALALLICDLMFRRWWKRFLFMALAVVVPIVANVFRAYGIIMLAHLSDFEIAVGVDHLVYGWVFLTFVTAILIGIALWLRDDASAASPDDEAGPSPAQHHRGGHVLAVGIAMLVLLTVRGYGAWAVTPAERPAPAMSVPASLGAWTRVEDVRPAWRGDFPGADVERTWTFRRGEHRVTLYFAGYTHERPDAELVSNRNNLTGGEGAAVLSRGRGDGPAIGALPRPAHLLVNAPRQGSSRLVWYWYRVGATVTNSGMQAKLNGLKAQVLTGPPPAALIAVSTAAGEDSPEVLSEFVRALHLQDRVRMAGTTR